MTEDTAGKRTALYERHVRSGARMAPFGGYLMPISYKGILSEHEAARKAAAVFDTCHMGEIRLAGKNVLPDLDRLLTCDLDRLAVGGCRYGLMCNSQGGVMDDLLVYRLEDAEYMLVVNAATRDEDLRWISEQASEGTVVEDISESTAKMDILRRSPYGLNQFY